MLMMMSRLMMVVRCSIMIGGCLVVMFPRRMFR